MTNTQKVERARHLQDGKTVDDAGVTIAAGRIGDQPVYRPFTHDPRRPTNLDLSLFADWRVSKCDPVADTVQDRMADLNIGLMQLVGECAEVSEALIHADSDGDDLGVIAGEILSECGDVLFSLCWAADAWGLNPFRHEPDAFPTGLPDLDVDLHSGVDYPLLDTAHQMLVRAGLLVDSYKKLSYQRRPVPPERQYERFCLIVTDVIYILGRFGYSLADCLGRCIEKLDARYPAGVAAPPGGFRDGKGA